MDGVELGMKVKDEVTGFNGIVTGIARYIKGRVDALVEAPATAEGKTPSEWIAVARLIPIE